MLYQRDKQTSSSTSSHWPPCACVGKSLSQDSFTPGIKMCFLWSDCKQISLHPVHSHLVLTRFFGVHIELQLISEIMLLPSHLNVTSWRVAVTTLWRLFSSSSSSFFLYPPLTTTPNYILLFAELYYLDLRCMLCSMWSKCVCNQIWRWFGRLNNNLSLMRFKCIYTCTFMWWAIRL